MTGPGASCDVTLRILDGIKQNLTKAGIQYAMQDVTVAHLLLPDTSPIAPDLYRLRLRLAAESKNTQDIIREIDAIITRVEKAGRPRRP